MKGTVDSAAVESFCDAPRAPELLGKKWRFDASKELIGRVCAVTTLLHNEVASYRASLFHQVMFGSLDWKQPPCINEFPFQDPNGTLPLLLGILERGRVDCLFNYSEGLRILAEIAPPAESSQKEFTTKFKKLTEMRHSLLHRVEVQADFERNSLKGARNKTDWLRKSRESQLLIGQGSTGFVLTSTRKGEWLELDVGPNAYASLVGNYHSLLEALAGQSE